MILSQRQDSRPEVSNLLNVAITYKVCKRSDMNNAPITRVAFRRVNTAP